MTGSAPPPKSILPSRKKQLDDAVATSERGGTVFIVGDMGTGRTTFGLQLLERLQQKFHRLIGSPALSKVPFSTLGILASQIPGEPMGASPIELVQAIGQATQNSHVAVFLDHAEYVDAQSAAVLKQLQASGNIRLLISTSSVRSLPHDLLTLLSLHDSLRVDLNPLILPDAEMLLAEVLEGQINPSAATGLLEMSAGHALHLRELALDAKSAGALSEHGGYWTLDMNWIPRGSRTSDLVATRLGNQPGDIRESIELLAVTGPLELSMAIELMGSSVFDAVESGLAALNVISENPATGERLSLVMLGAGLSPQLVLSTFDAMTLRRHLVDIEQRLPWDRFDAEFRSRYTRHRLEMGLPVPSQELLADTLEASKARQFSRVLALTSLLDRRRVDEWECFQSLLVARADALYELRQPEAAFELLQPYLEMGDSELRFVAAKIAYASLGRTQVAEQILAPRPGDPESVGAYLQLIRSRSNQVADVAALREFAESSALSAEGRAACLAHVLIEQAYCGRAEDSMAEFLRYSQDPQFSREPASARSELLFALPSLTFTVGAAPSSMLGAARDFGAEQLKPNQGNVMISTGLSLLECGLAVQALEAFEQALSYFAVNDTYLLKGFVALLASKASALLGDRAGVLRYLELFRSEPDVSGQIVRPAAMVGLVSVLSLAEGQDSALQEYERQLSQAQGFGRHYLAMRLHLEGWQCGLLQDAKVLSQSASAVQGPLARLLESYAPVLSDPTELSAGAIVGGHMEAEHVLLAAQFANSAASRARALGRRSVAAQLLNMAVELARPLVGVNTFALGRGRIDPTVLTEREYASCILAAQGASNQAISQKLFLSTRTVEGHLQKSYAKLGIVDRRQLIPLLASMPAPDSIPDLG